MVKSNFLNYLLLFLQIWLEVNASTHWVVTENGRIQPVHDSPFHLRRPYDLLALLDQETRRNEINNIYQDLMHRKSTIDKKSSGLEGASDLEARVYSQDTDCLKAGKLLGEIDLYTSIATNGSDRDGIQFETYQNNDSKLSDDFGDLVPDCTKYHDLHFSMFTYEHLFAMRNRKNTSLSSESNLEYLIPSSSVKSFGEQIAAELSKNKTSWLHYNLASLYWRIEGDGLNAMECARRALHFVSRKYRDIPLLNLAGIFHQSRQSKEAAILLHAAIDHNPYQASSYLALGNVYAVLADYNNSVNCYDNFLKLQPGIEDVLTAKYATLCHKKLESGLLQLHESLQDILSDLHDYHSQQQQWLRLQERLLWEQAPLEAKFKLGNIISNRGQRCVQRTTDNSKSTIMCDFIDHPLPSNAHVDIISLLRNFESASKTINEHISLIKKSGTKVFTKNKIVLEVPDIKAKDDIPTDSMQKYPTTMSLKSNLYFDSTGWPSKDECIEWNLPVKEKDDLLLPVFMPPENKGYKVKKMLSEYINIPEGAEHELPWYPPICELAQDENSLLPEGVRNILTDNLKSHPYLKKIFLSYVNNGNAEEAEIGQRIITAIHKKAGPTWVLTTLASLYWRIRSNTNNVVNCLDLPFSAIPQQHADVVLISISSLFHQMGLIEHAVQFATLALKVNYAEPSTNFLLALLHYTQNNPILAMYYMKNVLRVEPDFYNGQAERLLKTWACRIKMGNYELVTNKKEKREEMCGEKDKQNEGVVCSANGELCKTAAIQCFRTEKVENSEGLLINHPITKVISNSQCSKGRGLGQFLISTLLATEGSGGLEPDQSQLESLPDGQQKTFHMRITLDDDNTPSSNTLSDFYVSVSLTDETVPEAVLHVYDKTGTYQLSNHQCRDIQDADWINFTSMWKSVATRNIDIAPFLKTLDKSVNEGLEPFCFKPFARIPGSLGITLDFLLNNPLPKLPEESLFECLALMANDHESTLEQLGTKISIALQENVTSWVLNTAAAIYWRIVGNAKEAAICLQHAMSYAPQDMRDIPLINLANLLHMYSFTFDALGVAHVALKYYPEFAVTHFTLGNIYNALGEVEKAISYYRSSLAIDPNFEPARNRLLAVLCTFLFDESGIFKENDVFEN